MGKRSFSKTYASLTDIGRTFGMSAIAVGRRLDEAGLRDPGTRRPTGTCLARGTAVATPMRDGTQHFMWDRRTVAALLRSDRAPLDRLEAAVFDFRRAYHAFEREADAGFDKMAYLGLQGTIEDLPADIRFDVLVRVLGETDARAWMPGAATCRTAI